MTNYKRVSDCTVLNRICGQPDGITKAKLFTLGFEPKFLASELRRLREANLIVPCGGKWFATFLVKKDPINE